MRRSDTHRCCKRSYTYTHGSSRALVSSSTRSKCSRWGSQEIARLAMTGSETPSQGMCGGDHDTGRALLFELNQVVGFTGY